MLPTRADRMIVMGVLNVTPDSFSDGGRFEKVDQALAQARQMWSAGADLIDVGGESTRPGAVAVDAATEKARVLPVITELVAAGIAVSVDTYRAEVAAAALAAGAVLVNDVSGGRADIGMAAVVRDAGCGWVLMHWRAPSASMAAHARYDDVVEDVRSELARQFDVAVAAGVAPEQIALDPGIGFAKTAVHNWALLRGLDRIVDLGRPVLVGASRKSFLGALLADPAGASRPPQRRDAATVALTAVSALAGAWAVRVHDVGPNVDAALAAAAVLGAGDSPAPVADE